LIRAAILLLVALSASAGEKELVLPPPNGQPFWTLEQKRVGFRNMARIYLGHAVAHGPRVYALPREPRELKVEVMVEGKRLDVAGFMAHNEVSGLIVLYRGRIVLERYALGRSEQDLWPSFSVAKSVTSTLLGAALRDGAIQSLEDPVSRYLPELAQTGYEGVSIRQALTMAVGLAWNEDYEDPNSDWAKIRSLPSPGDDRPGVDVIAHLAKLPRVAAPGSVFHYNSGNAQLLGVLVQRATGKSLAAYLSEKIWAPFGMEADAFWVRDREGRTLGSSLLNARLRDYARFGYFFMHGGAIDGRPVLPDGWVTDATRAHLKSDWEDWLYGYEWWVRPDGPYSAIGIFGQELYLDPRNDVVIVTNSAWSEADWDPGYAATAAFNLAVVRALTAPSPAR
jgi:CubicO group peptidase (beta-lactamase class C family)